jgi:hypothetical protein
LPARLQRILNAEGSDTVTVDMLNTFRSLREFDELARKPFVAFLEPPSIDPRIVNQFALFSLMSSPTATMDDWVREHPSLCRRVIIPAALKWEIRDKLDQANVNERILFPDLDGLSRWLARYYLPAGRAERDTIDPNGRATRDASSRDHELRRTRRAPRRRTSRTRSTRR